MHTMDAVARYRNDTAHEEIAVYRDDSASDPIKEETWFRFVNSSGYALGHEHVSGDELEEQVKEANAYGTIVLPVFINDHGQVSVTVGTAGTWDGEPCAIFISKAGCDEIGIDPDTAVAQVEAEISQYNEWLAGETYGYIRYTFTTCNLGHVHATKTDDSCWGFRGSNIAFLLYDSGVSTDSETVKLCEGWTELQGV